MSFSSNLWHIIITMNLLHISVPMKYFLTVRFMYFLQNLHESAQGNLFPIIVLFLFFLIIHFAEKKGESHIRHISAPPSKVLQPTANQQLRVQSRSLRPRCHCSTQQTPLQTQLRVTNRYLLCLPDAILCGHVGAHVRVGHSEVYGLSRVAEFDQFRGATVTL